LTKQQLESEIKKSSIYKSLQREVVEFKNKVEKLENKNENLQKSLEVKTQLSKELSDKCNATDANHQQLIAQGIAHGLNNRIAPWLATTEKLSLTNNTNENILDVASSLLALQQTRDKRYGTRTSIKSEIEAARQLKVALIEAKKESLRPLPNLSEVTEKLSSHIENQEKLLIETSLIPKSEKLQTLRQELQLLSEMEQLLEMKKAFEKKMLTEAWGNELCKLAYSEFNRRGLEIYDSDQKALGVEKNELLFITAQQHFLNCLLSAKPLRLLIDGHNVLPKIKPLIGNDFFSKSKGPKAEARNLLIERIKLFTNNHPLIQADVWFDGPKEQDWTESENLRVWFSGGTGEGRADEKILENLKSFDYRKSSELIFLVTEDKDLLAKGRELLAVEMSPIEMWTLVN